MWLWASHTGVNGPTLASMHIGNGSIHGLALGYGMTKSIPWIRVSLNLLMVSSRFVHGSCGQQKLASQRCN